MSLRECRVRAGLKIPEVAETLGVTRTMVYYWESGRYLPKTNKLNAIAELYGATIDELLKNEERT